MADSKVFFLMTASLTRWTNASRLLAKVREGGFDGIDIVIGRETEELEVLRALHVSPVPLCIQIGGRYLYQISKNL